MVCERTSYIGQHIRAIGKERLNYGKDDYLTLYCFLTFLCLTGILFFVYKCRWLEPLTILAIMIDSNVLPLFY